MCKSVKTVNVHSDCSTCPFLGARFSGFEDLLADCSDLPAFTVAKDFASGFFGVFLMSFVASFGLLTCLAFFSFDGVCKFADSSVTSGFDFGVSTTREGFFLFLWGGLVFLPKLSPFSGLCPIFCINTNKKKLPFHPRNIFPMFFRKKDQ